MPIIYTDMDIWPRPVTKISSLPKSGRSATLWEDRFEKIKKAMENLDHTNMDTDITGHNAIPLSREWACYKIQLRSIYKERYYDPLEKAEIQTPEFCMDIVRKNAMAIKYVRNQTPEICLEAVNADPKTLEFVNNQTPEICLTAVTMTGFALMYVKEQTLEICLAAVRQQGLALQYVKEQTPEICMAAVQSNGRALQFVLDKQSEIIFTAIKKSAYALQFVEDKTDEMWNLAAEANPSVMQYKAEDKFYRSKLIEKQYLYGLR